MADKRFLLPAEVAEILDISMSQTMAMLRSGELPSITLGGKSVYRIEISELEAYIQRRRTITRETIERRNRPAGRPGTSKRGQQQPSPPGAKQADRS